jgi:hypothetical protein
MKKVASTLRKTKHLLQISMAILFSSSALRKQREPEGLGAIRVGNQPTPPSARYSSGVGLSRPTPYFNPFPYTDSMQYGFLANFYLFRPPE